MTQLELGMELKKRGKERAMNSHAAALEMARKIARDLADDGRTITADDVRERMNFLFTYSLGNAAGAIFDGEEWECVGYRPSMRPSRHGGLLRVWRLKP